MFIVEQQFNGSWFLCGEYSNFDRAEAASKIYELGYGSKCRIIEVEDNSPKTDDTKDAEEDSK